MSTPDGDILNPDEIDALLNSAAGGGSPLKPSPEPAPPKKPAGGESALLDPSEIDALLAQATSKSQAEPPKPAAAPKPQPAKPAASTSPPPKPKPAPAPVAASPTRPSPDKLLADAEASLAAALAPNLDRGQSQGRSSTAALSAKPYEFEAFDPRANATGNGVGLESLQDVELDLCIELGRTELLIEEVMQLREGSVVPLDKLAGDPVDILVNGRLIARGEVLVLNDNFCVRVAEILSPEF